MRFINDALRDNHRDITVVQVHTVNEAVNAFDGHDIVITDQSLLPSGFTGQEGIEVAEKIKRKNPKTVVIINSVFPPFLLGKSEFEADYAYDKGTDRVYPRGSFEPITDVGTLYDNLAWLVRKIEKENLKISQ